MNNTVIFSLKPKFTSLIESGKKNYEYRKYVPRNLPKEIIFYISAPVSKLIYIVETDKPIKYPDKVEPNGYGNDEFNKGLKESKYAFPIKHLYKLNNPLSLNLLRKKYSFSAPQSFAYLKTYEKLKEHVESTETTKLF